MKQLVSVLLEILIALGLFALFVYLMVGVDWSQARIPPEPAEQIAERVDSDGFDAERSGKWRTVRNRYAEENPECAACGTTENINVHHVLSFKDYPELELDPDNLITLCREHHFFIGHDADGPSGPDNPNWKESNPNVRRDAKRYRDSLELAP